MKYSELKSKIEDALKIKIVLDLAHDRKGRQSFRAIKNKNFVGWYDINTKQVFYSPDIRKLFKK